MAEIVYLECTRMWYARCGYSNVVAYDKTLVGLIAQLGDLGIEWEIAARG